MSLWKLPTNSAWSITEDALGHIIDLAKENETTPEAIAANLGKQLENTYRVSEVNGVAVLPVVGALFRYSSWFTRIIGASTYDRIAHDFTQAVNNPEIKSIILEFDSPGGEVNGCAELANLIFEARGKKPIIAYASGDCASGAYWIASACDKILVSDTAALGSIGVVAVYRRSDSENKNIEIVSSQSPFKRLNPSEDEGREKIQANIDALADVFINSIAAHRNITPDKVKKEFGKGDVFIGQDAVRQGLADDGGTLEKIISSLSTTETNSPPGAGFFISKGKVMDLETIKSDHPNLSNQLIAEGQKNERERIGAILNHDEAKGRNELANHLALNTDLSPEAVQVALKQVPQKAQEPKAEDPKPKETPEDQSGFSGVMASLGNPDIQTSGDGGEQEETAEDVAARIAGYSNNKSNQGVVA